MACAAWRGWNFTSAYPVFQAWEEPNPGIPWPFGTHTCTRSAGISGTSDVVLDIGVGFWFSSCARAQSTDACDQRFILSLSRSECLLMTHPFWFARTRRPVFPVNEECWREGHADCELRRSTNPWIHKASVDPSPFVLYKLAPIHNHTFQRHWSRLHV